ncbi:MAG: lipoyl synthase [Planctomycetota bacterium]
MKTPTKQTRRRLPPWLTRRVAAGKTADRVAALLDELNLATVCDEARCPNRHECYCRGTATFLILGSSCTRNCRFCAVADDDPQPVRQDEPDAVAVAAERMKLRHVVITSVTRDDLPDGGAGHFARTIEAVRARCPDAAIEVLVPDFRGDRAAIETVLAWRPDVFNHNVETVPRLYPRVRPQADYRRSLDVLACAARSATVRTKSGLMVGLGETSDEIDAVLGDLRDAGCAILTVGQYLAPSNAHVPVARFVPPTEFDAIKARAEAMGFAAVAAGPFVRSSYNAEQVYRDGHCRVDS